TAPGRSPCVSLATCAAPRSSARRPAQRGPRNGPHTPNARDAPAKPWRPRHPWARDRHLRGPEMAPHTPNARDAPAKPWRPRHPWARDRHLRGPEMAPYPQRSGRPGKAVAPSTSVGAGSALEGPRDGPPYPQRSGRPGKAVAPSTSVGAGSALEGPRDGPIPPTLGTPRQSRGALDIRGRGIGT